MANRQAFRISKQSPSRRLYSEGERKQSMDVVFSKLDSEESPSPERRAFSPGSNSSTRRRVVRIQQTKPIRKISDKDNKNKKQGTEQYRQDPPHDSKCYYDNKEQNALTLIRVPMEPQPAEKAHEPRRERLVTFSDPNPPRKFSECTTNSNKQAPLDFNLELYSEANKILQELADNLEEGKTSPVLRRYIEVVSGGALDNCEHTVINPVKRKLIKTSIEYERISVLLVAMSEATGSLEANRNLLYNLLKCIADNQIMILSLLKRQKKTPQDQTVLNSLQLPKNTRGLHNFLIIKNNTEIMLNLIYKLTAEKNHFTENLRKLVKYGDFGIQKYFYLLLQHFALYLHILSLEDKIPFLATAPNPYLPPTDRYTLVIDVAEVLYNNNCRCCRPYSQAFIEKMGEYFQIVSYSAMLPKEMQPLIRFIDRRNLISHKLYQHHFYKQKQKFKKDLSRMGRPLSQLILLDVETNQLAPNNTYVVKKWANSCQDKVLEQIMFFLSSIPVRDISVQEALGKQRQEQEKKKNKARKYKYSDQLSLE